MLKEELGLEAELKQGSGGIFEVSVGGAVVAKRGFSGFPTEEEIVQAVSKASGQVSR